MSNTEAFARGTVMFREGDSGDCMYELESGGVGIYHDYGGPDEKLITTLYNSSNDIKVFGETAVSCRLRPASSSRVLL